MNIRKKLNFPQLLTLLPKKTMLKMLPKLWRPNLTFMKKLCGISKAPSHPSTRKKSVKTNSINTFVLLRFGKELPDMKNQ